MSYSGCRERKLALTLILANKIVDICVKIFHLVRGVQSKCVFHLESALKTRFKLGKSFCFGLISGSCIVFFFFFGFLRSFMGFSRCLGSFLGQN
jgi:hypothetical protein